MSLDVTFRQELRELSAKGDLRQWRDCARIYADALDDADRSRAAQRLRQAAETRRAPGVLWPAPRLLKGVSDHQRAAYRRATRNRLGLLTGTPGTGKTHTTAECIRVLCAQHGDGNVAVCAPTGKAAVRLGDALRRAGVEGVQPTTIHQLLEIQRNGHDGEGWDFARGPGNPLDERFVIVDEASMLDCDLAANLLTATDPQTHVLLVGDPYQLPPVGHGAPLRDLIACKLAPVGELTEIRRNSGMIVEACAAVKDGKAPEVSEVFFGQEGEHESNLIHVEASTPTEQTGALHKIINTVITGTRVVADLQVLVSTNARRDQLNVWMQDRLNDHSPFYERNPFRAGDKVICLRNHWAPAAIVRPDGGFVRQGEVYVANGEQGRAAAVEPRGSFLHFPNPSRTVWVPVAQRGDRDAVDATGTADFDLGYAITGHKCVHPDTLVETTDGLLPIRLIDGEGTLAAPHGASAYRNKVWNPAAPALRLTTEGGYSLSVTCDHRVERWNGVGYEIVEASRVRPGEWMRLKLGATVEPRRPAALPAAPTSDVRAMRHRIPEVVSVDLAEFLGMMVADGTLWDAGFRLLKRHADVAERFRHLVSSLFGVEPRSVSLNGAVGYEVSSTMLASWLALFGSLRPDEKAVPECVLRSPSHIHAAFLRGLFEDGTVNVRDGLCDHISITQARRHILEVAQVMLLRLGIPSRLTTLRRGITGLYIFGAYAAVFRDRIGFVSAFKQNRLAACRSSLSRFLVPIGRDEAKAIRSSHPSAFGEFAYQNARARGVVSKRTVEQITNAVGAVWEMRGLQARAEWHHEQVASVEPTVCESMCVEVPDGHRFLQNGFPHCNSQGSEWPVVVVMIDSGFGPMRVQSREWLYTAISRASRLCITVGRRGVLEMIPRRPALDKRKTFLAELIRGEA